MNNVHFENVESRNDLSIARKKSPPFQSIFGTVGVLDVKKSSEFYMYFCIMHKIRIIYVFLYGLQPRVVERMQKKKNTFKFRTAKNKLNPWKE